MDLTNCSPSQVEKTVRTLSDLVTTLPRRSVLILCDFNRALFDEEAVRAMKEVAVFNKPFIKKTAWVGAEHLPDEYAKRVKDFSRREFPVFDTHSEAMDWLVED